MRQFPTGRPRRHPRRDLLRTVLLTVFLTALMTTAVLLAASASRAGGADDHLAAVDGPWKDARQRPQ